MVHFQPGPQNDDDAAGTQEGHGGNTLKNINSLVVNLGAPVSSWDFRGLTGCTFSPQIRFGPKSQWFFQMHPWARVRKGAGSYSKGSPVPLKIFGVGKWEGFKGIYYCR